MSRLDQIYRRFILTSFFTKGWGKPENLKRIFDARRILSNRESCYKLVPPDYPVHIDKDELQGDVRILEGHFDCPYTKVLPGIMPKETQVARFQVILPKTWKGKHKPICLHLAGTGDHYFWRRRILMARPLLKENEIASIVLESPYYGCRKPKQQLRSSLHNVSDLFVMGGALIMESLVLFHWCERQGFGPLGVTGISMGGFMASLAASNWPKPLSLIPCLSWSTASGVFTKGVMSGAIPWKLLENQYAEDSVYDEELKNMIISPEEIWGSTYSMGQEFVRTFSEQFDPNVAEKDKEGSYLLFKEKVDNLCSRTQANQNTEPSDENVSSREVQGMDIKADIEAMEDYLSKKHDISNQGPKKLALIERIQQTNSKIMNYVSLSGFGTLSGKPQTMPKIIPKTNFRPEALDFMRGVMDECTHLAHYSIPVDTSLIIILAAKQDAYVIRKDVLSLDKVWPGAEVRYIDSGHVGAFLFHNHLFRKAIAESFQRQIDKYYR